MVIFFFKLLHKHWKLHSNYFQDWNHVGLNEDNRLNANKRTRMQLKSKSFEILNLIQKYPSSNANYLVWYQHVSFRVIISVYMAVDTVSPNSINSANQEKQTLNHLGRQINWTLLTFC